MILPATSDAGMLYVRAAMARRSTATFSVRTSFWVSACDSIPPSVFSLGVAGLLEPEDHCSVSVADRSSGSPIPLLQVKPHLRYQFIGISFSRL